MLMKQAVGFKINVPDSFHPQRKRAQKDRRLGRYMQAAVFYGAAADVAMLKGRASAYRRLIELGTACMNKFQMTDEEMVRYTANAQAAARAFNTSRE